MALSLINYFFLDIPNARVPCMLLDCVVIYGLNYWEKKLKAEKTSLEQEAAQAQAQQHETDKKAKNAEKAANREQRKAEEKKMKHSQGNANFGMKNPIKQPDKGKKMH